MILPQLNPPFLGNRSLFLVFQKNGGFMLGFGQCAHFKFI